MTSPELSALFRAIAADPESNVPRLVAADWLEEHGDAEWAHAIRQACEPLPLAIPAHLGSPSANDAVLRHRMKALNKIVGRIDYDRGFPDRVTLSVDTLNTTFEAANAWWPIWHVKVNQAKGRETELARSRNLRQVRWLNLDYNQFTTGGSETVLKSPHLGHLERLTLNNNPLGVGGGDALAAISLPKLTHLALANCKLARGKLAAILRNRRLGPVAHWCLDSCDSPATELNAFLDTGRLAHVRTWDLNGSFSGLQFLAEVMDVVPVERLDLSCIHASIEVAHRALSSPTYSQIRELKLRSLELPNSSPQDMHELAGVILASGRFRTLEKLDLSFSVGVQSINGEDFFWKDVLPLFTPEHLPNLRYLNLTGWGINNGRSNAHADVWQTFIDQFVPQLTVLDLCLNTISGADLRRLIESPSARNLVGLSLDMCDLTDADVNRLAKSPHLSRLQCLHLDGNHRLTPVKVVKAIRASESLRGLRSLLLPGTFPAESATMATLAEYYPPGVVRFGG